MLDTAACSSCLPLREHGNIVVQKGGVDTIQHLGCTMQCKEEGGLKRSGDLGDVLAGTILAFMAWNVVLEKDVPNEQADCASTNSKSIHSMDG